MKERPQKSGAPLSIAAEHELNRIINALAVGMRLPADEEEEAILASHTAAGGAKVKKVGPDRFEVAGETYSLACIQRMTAALASKKKHKKRK